MIRRFFIFSILCLFLNSCFLSLHHRRKPALIRNVNIDETLKISKDEMQKKNLSQSLGLWVIRDQIVTPAQAKIISELYLSKIDSMNSDFNIWHSSWAISNLYRFGDEAVKKELETAYQKAKKQPERITKKGTRRLAAKQFASFSSGSMPFSSGNRNKTPSFAWSCSSRKCPNS